jgi:intracellular sulfur oxidation DsrE/DsrF family protein
MNKDEHYSEEQLNAFVDGELDPEEKSRLYNESERSPDLDQRLCRQRKMKDLVQHAYAEVPPPSRSGGTPLTRTGFLGRMLAAGFLIAIGLSAGVIAHQYLDQRQIDTSSVTANATLPVQKIDKYLLHVVSGEPEQMLAALEHATHLLESAGSGEVRQVEIVANERGLDLLRSDVTPFATEIAALQQHNVVFYACSRTIERLEEQGVTVQLVPLTNPNYTALDRVVTRMQEGWKYEKI